jgi:hypothetical protein
MTSNNILLVSPYFEPSNCANYQLTLKLGVDTFSYCITDPINQQLLVLFDEQECEDVAQKYLNLLTVDTYLQHEFAQVTLAVHPNNQIFAPSELQAIDATTYSKYFQDNNFDQINCQKALNASINQFYTTPQKVISTAESKWKNVRLSSQNIGLIELIDGDCVYIEFTVSSFQFIYAKQGKLVYYQIFTFDNLDELNYYVLLNNNQLNIDSSRVKAKICGIIHRDDEKWNILNQIYPQTDLLIVDTLYDTRILDDMPKPYYSSLLALL